MKLLHLIILLCTAHGAFASYIEDPQSESPLMRMPEEIIFRIMGHIDNPADGVGVCRTLERIRRGRHFTLTYGDHTQQLFEGLEKSGMPISRVKICNDINAEQSADLASRGVEVIEALRFKGIMQNVRSFTMLRELRLSWDTLDSVALTQLGSALPYLNNLEKLNIYPIMADDLSPYNLWIPELLDKVRCHPSLRHLSLARLDSTQADLKGLRQCTNLRSLSLRFTDSENLKSIGIAEALAKLTRLTSLALHCHSDEFMAGVVETSLPALQMLEELNLEESPLSTVADKLCQVLPMLTNLGNLNLSRTGLENDQAAQVIRSLNNLNELRVLNLQYLEASPSFYQNLALILPSKTKLRQLDIPFTMDRGIALLALFKSMRALSNLQRFNCPFVTNSLQVVEEFSTTLACLPNLEDFEFTRPSAEPYSCGIMLRGLTHCHHLTRLLIENWQFKDESLSSLAQVLKQNPSMKELWLDSCRLDAKSMAVHLSMPLTELTRLENLSLAGNPLEDEGLTYLAAAFPSWKNSLRSLNIMDTSLTCGNGFAVFAQELKHLTRLRDMVLKGNTISAEGVAVMCDNLQYLPTFHALTMAGCKLVHESALILAHKLHQLRHLSKLCLNSNKITSDAWDALQHALQNHPTLKKIEKAF